MADDTETRTLDDYHRADCDSRFVSVCGDSQRCSCGLDALIAALRAEKDTPLTPWCDCGQYGNADHTAHHPDCRWLLHAGSALDSVGRTPEWRENAFAGTPEGYTAGKITDPDFYRLPALPSAETPSNG